MNGGYSSPGSIETGNRLGNRPTVRQSKIYRTNESGNAMKGLLGQSNLAWETDQQQGVFSGHAVYDGESGTYQGGASLPQHQYQQQQAFPPPQQQQQQWQYQPPPQQPQHQRPPQAPPAAKKKVAFGGPGAGGGDCAGCSSGGGFGGGGAPTGEAEYPLPGSVASCDACGSTVDRYYHCADCIEATGLFDLCVRCCGAIYLQGGAMRIDHPTHDYQTHRMQHITPPDHGGMMGAGR